MLRSPKDKFLATTHKGEFNKIIQQPAFEEAISAALLQMQFDMPLDCSPNQAADFKNQTAGAIKFIDIFCKISLPEPKSKQSESKGVNYDAQ